MKFDIDDKLINLIKDLNDNGFETFSSCQGRTEINDKHCPHAFISFVENIPKKYRIKARKLDLDPDYNGSFSIASKVYEDTSDEIAISINSKFVDKIYEIFNLKNKLIKS